MQKQKKGWLVCILVLLLCLIAITAWFVKTPKAMKDISTTNSILKMAYWKDQEKSLTDIYQILYPDNPLQLDTSIGFYPIEKEKSYSGTFLFCTTDVNQWDGQERIQARHYMEVASFLYQIAVYGADVYHSSYNAGISLELEPVDITKEDRLAWAGTKSGLQQLLKVLQITISEEAVEQLWQMVKQQASRELG